VDAPDADAPDLGGPADSAGAALSGAQPAEAKSAYPPPASIPTQVGPAGIRFDFNQGARVVLPKRAEGEPAWKVRLRDLDTGNILFESANRGATVASSKRFYVRFRVEVSDGETPVLEHDYDCGGKDVLIVFPVGTLGDTLAWFPYADRFHKTHGCRLTCALSGLIIPILKGAYPGVTFVTHEEMVERKIAEGAYATYYMGLFFGDEENTFQPTDFRLVGLHRTAGYILGVGADETPPKLALADESRPIVEP